MPTAIEDVLGLSPPARRILADMEVRRRGCIAAFLYTRTAVLKMIVRRIGRQCVGGPMLDWTAILLFANIDIALLPRYSCHIFF